MVLDHIVPFRQSSHFILVDLAQKFVQLNETFTEISRYVNAVNPFGRHASFAFRALLLKLLQLFLARDCVIGISEGKEFSSEVPLVEYARYCANVEPIRFEEFEDFASW